MYFEIYEDRKRVFGGSQKTGKWRWRARSQNGNILADSGQGYSGGRSRVIQAVKKFVGYFQHRPIKIKDLSCGEEITL